MKYPINSRNFMPLTFWIDLTRSTPGFDEIRLRENEQIFAEKTDLDFLFFPYNEQLASM